MSKYKGYFKTIVTKAKYSEENALSLAIACDLAYKKRKFIKTTAHGWGYSQVEFFEVK
ncbi:MAG: hypothetical protein JKY88_03700 [Pseudomonadales bacterium]|nr:hypothetical protein [Pseudomonadales bacterium]